MGNILLGGIIGMLIDYATDNMWIHNPQMISLDLTRASSAPNEFEINAPVRLNYPNGTYETVFLPIKFYKKDSNQARSLECIRLEVKQEDCIDALEELAKQDSINIRSQVASNPHATDELLENLAEDDHHLVRGRVASNPNTPVEILRKLARDPNSSVRWEVASNPSTPTVLLHKLASDDNAAVSERATYAIEEELHFSPDY